MKRRGVRAEDISQPASHYQYRASRRSCRIRPIAASQAHVKAMAQPRASKVSVDLWCCFFFPVEFAPSRTRLCTAGGAVA